MRYLLLILAVLAASPSDAGNSRLRCRNTKSDRTKGCGFSADQYVAYTGRSTPTSVDTSFCSTYSSSMTGNWFCFDPSGTYGTLTLTREASMVSGLAYPCPNGPGCSTVTRYRINGTSQYWKTGNTTAPSGNFSVCVLRQVEGTATAEFISKWTAANVMTFTFENQGTSSGPRLYVSNDGTTTGVSAASTVLNFAPMQLHCATYNATSGLITTYVDGVSTGTGTKAGTKTPYSQNVPIYVGFKDVGTPSSQAGGHLLAFFTETELSAATMTSMAASVNPELKTSSSGTVTTTRSSTRSCMRTTAGVSQNGSLLVNNQECVDDQNRLHVWLGSTNYIAYSTDVVNNWTAYNTPTESADVGNSPFRTQTADLVGDDSATTVEGEERVTAAITAGAAYTLSCYASSGTSSTGRLVLDGTSCPITTNSTWQRFSCTDASASGVTIVAGIWPTDATVASTGNMYFWGCQVNAGSWASPYIPTFATAPVSSQADTITVANPYSGTAPAEWCVGVTINKDGGFLTNHGILQVGTATANSVQIWANSTGQVIARSYNGASVEQYRTSCTAPLLTAGTAARIKLVVSAGVLTLYIDGTACTQTRSPSTAYTITHQANNYLGTSIGSFDGYIYNIAFDDHPNSTKCD